MSVGVFPVRGFINIFLLSNRKDLMVIVWSLLTSSSHISLQTCHTYLINCILREIEQEIIM